MVSGFTANGATADHWQVALCSESQRGRQSDKVQGTFCGAWLHADTWLRLPRDVLTNGQTVNIEDSACVWRETGHQVPANGHKVSLPQCTHRRRDFSGAARRVQAGRQRHGLQTEEIAVRAQTVRAQLVRVPSTSTGAAGVSFFAARQASLDATQKRGNHHCWALVWVDDIVYGSTDEDFGRWFEADVGKQFTIGDFGPLAWFLGLAFKAEQDGLTLSHKLYISNLLTTFGMHNCKIASTPLPEKCALSKDGQPEDGSGDVSKIAECNYRGLVGSISYLAMKTRPDLAFSAHLLSRFLNNHNLVHWSLAGGKTCVAVPQGHRRRGHYILAGLRGTLDRVLRRGLRELERRPQSVTGYCFNYGSGAISWSAKKQTCVATSTTEAEVHALSEAVKEALHLQGILECIGETKQTTILSDSQSCLALISEDDGSYKAKHFATRLAFLKDTVKCSVHRIDLKFVPSADNMADLLTKGLGRIKTIQHTKGLSAKRGCQVQMAASRPADRLTDIR